MTPLSLYDPELVRGAYHPRATAYYFRRWRHFVMDVHAHDAVEIMYVLSGTCRVEAERGSFEMKNGQLILLDARVPHRLIVDPGPCRMLNVEFVFDERQGPFPTVSDLCSASEALQSFLSDRRPHVLLKDREIVYQATRDLVLELDHHRGSMSLLAHLYWAQALLAIARLAEEAKSLSRSAHRYVQQAIEFIHENYDSPLKAGDIAAAVNLHPGYLHRLFKAETGVSLMAYVTRYRIEKAKMLLANTGIPVTQIGDYVGIGSSQYFSAVFKRHVGQTPSEYRDAVERLS